MSYIRLPKPPEQRINLPEGSAPLKAEQLFTLASATHKISDKNYGHVIFALGSTPEEVEAAEAHVIRQLASDRVYVRLIADDLNDEETMHEALGEALVARRTYNEALTPWYDASPDPYGSTLRSKPDVVVLDKAGLKAMYYPWFALEYHITVIGLQVPEVDQLSKTNLDSLDQLTNTLFTNPYLNYLIPVLSNVQASVVLWKDGEPQKYNLNSQLNFFKRTEPTASETRLSVVNGKITVKKFTKASDETNN
jgi:hypothetical protein